MATNCFLASTDLGRDRIVGQDRAGLAPRIKRGCVAV